MNLGEVAVVPFVVTDRLAWLPDPPGSGSRTAVGL